MLKNHSWTYYVVLLLLVIIPLVNVKVYLGPIPISAEVFLIPLLTLVALYEYWTKKITLNTASGKWFAILMFLQFAIMLVSLTQAASILPGLMEAARYLSVVIMFLIIYKIQFTKQEYKNFAFTFLGVLSVMTLYGLFQFVFDFNLNKAGLYALEDAWGRVQSTTNNPNYYGGLLNFVIPCLMLVTFVYIRSRAVQLLFFIIFGLLVINQIFTYTRSAWVIMAFGMFLAAILVPKAFFKRLFKVHMIIAIVALGIVVSNLPDVKERTVSAIYVIESLTPVSFGGDNGDKIEPITEEDSAAEVKRKQNEEATNRAVVSRTTLWKTGWVMYKENPILGLGVGNYNVRYSDYVEKYPELNVGADLYSVHNSFLKVAAETGTIGLLSFLAIYLYYYLFLAKQYLRSKNDVLNKVLIVGIFVGSGAYLGQNLANNLIFIPQINIIFWLISALVLSFIATRDSSETQTKF